MNQLKVLVLKGLYILWKEQEQFLTLASHSAQITKKLQQTKTHIKSMLLFHGIKAPDQFDDVNWILSFIEWLE